MIKNKKAQHEIMGFVLIVVLISIIGVIFLSLSIGRGEASKQESIEISNLLEASMYYTTDCAVNFIPQYKDGQDLIKACYENEISECLNGEKVCDALNSTFSSLISESLLISPDKPNKAYQLKIYYKALDLEIADDIILELSEGEFANCSSTAGGSHLIPLTSISAGTINAELEVCKN